MKNVHRGIQVTMDVDNCLPGFYRAAAEKAETETVSEVFKTLSDMEQAYCHRVLSSLRPDLETRPLQLFRNPLEPGVNLLTQ